MAPLVVAAGLTLAALSAVVLAAGARLRRRMAVVQAQVAAWPAPAAADRIAA